MPADPSAPAPIPAKIRPYRPSDHAAGRDLWAALVELQRDMYDDPDLGGPDPGAGFEEYLTRLDLTGVWVADHDEGGVVGLAGLILDGRAGEVEPVVVAQRMRGRGIGRALLEHVAEEARRRGLASLTISPPARDEAAIRSFHAAGFDILSAVRLTLDLGPSRREWRSGLEILGREFRY